jgi:predicted Rossmann-fold nucleotide-binding protein
LLNVSNYFGGLLRYLEHAEAEGFWRPQHRGMLVVAQDPADLMRKFAEYRAPVLQKWMT